MWLNFFFHQNNSKVYYKGDSWPKLLQLGSSLSFPLSLCFANKTQKPLKILHQMFHRLVYEQCNRCESFVLPIFLKNFRIDSNQKLKYDTEMMIKIYSHRKSCFEPRFLKSNPNGFNELFGSVNYFFSIYWLVYYRTKNISGLILNLSLRFLFLWKFIFCEAVVS